LQRKLSKPAPTIPLSKDLESHEPQMKADVVAKVVITAFWTHISKRWKFMKQNWKNGIALKLLLIIAQLKKGKRKKSLKK